jgi:PEGA domain
MTTLRRALPGLYRRESILALATLVTLAMLFAGQPALAMSHGGGGGGHSGGGGGGHASGGSHSGGGGHMSAHGGMAHPIGGGHFFGPSRGFGFRGDHFFHGGRFFGGGGFFPFGFGLGLGLGFAWDYPWGWGPGFYGYWGPSWYGYNPGYGYYYPGYGYNGGYDGYGGDPNGYSAPAPRSRGEMGALDVAISPSDAEVYLNGEYIGRARDYSGWGRGYLWLEKGTYDIVFYKEGYRTLARQVSIYPGLVIKWDDKLEHGQAVRPEDLATKSHERRDSRLQFERDRAEQIDRQQQMQEPPPYQGQQAPPAPENSGGWNDNWRDRVNRDRGGNDNGATPQRNVQPAPAPGPARAAVTSDQYGRLRMKVEPDDASVYLDGRFVGTGSDLAGNEAGLLLSPGHHRVSIVRPGHRAEERDLDAVLGKDVDLTVNLKPSGPTG